MTKEHLSMADVIEGIQHDSLVEVIQRGLMKKEYLKMADVFRDQVQPERFNYALNSGKAKYAAHAINSHDELVAEVDRLRGVVDELERENENISAILLERTSALGPYI